MNGVPWMLGLSGEVPDDAVVRRAAGAGLVRGEYVLRRAGAYITKTVAQEHLADYLARLARAFGDRPVWYRLADFEAREIATLPGCDGHEVDEAPVLGARGVRRGLLYPDALATEAGVVAAVARRHRNLGVLVPYVGDADELAFAHHVLDAAGFANRRGSMLEIPAALVLVEELLAAVPVDACLIGLNDLTTLTLGAERHNRFHDKAHRGVWTLVRRAVEACARRGILCGLAGDLDPPALTRAAEVGLDHVVLHYHLLDRLVPGLVPARDRDVVRTLKSSMASALARETA